jgi:hypothetical protein
VEDGLVGIDEPAAPDREGEEGHPTTGDSS